MNDGHTMSELQKALGLLRAGDWEGAHVIVQEDESKLANWMHAIVHLLEGDTSNANYWFRQANQDPKTENDIAAELRSIEQELEGRLDG